MLTKKHLKSYFTFVVLLYIRNNSSMKAIIILLIFLALTSIQGFSQTKRITSFEALMESLNRGERLRIIIHYSQCSYTQDQKNHELIPDVITGMNIDTYEYFASGAVHNLNAFVVFSQTQLIKNPIGGGFVYNYGKVRINADNTVQVTTKYLNPKRLKVLMNQDFTCKINTGNNEGGINLFKENCNAKK